ncbi:signal peptidase I [Enterococcus sp. DIV0212c]|uniref:signal peptidase I n=1 Tax=Enterococcus sp. DIV0212c TaxID=2230867 RepID=UPI001A9AC701|nr:signal peptidase I [Enterococcus sp. DIV0212c]MBO1354990.1 signal peptidase I [Enterococcus sp. DIV0212c]
MSVSNLQSKPSSQAFSAKKSSSRKIKQRVNVPSKSMKRKKKRHSRRKIVKELYITFGIFLALLILVQKMTIALPKVEGYSMIPTLVDGNRVVVNKLGQVRRFKLIYFKDETGKIGAVRRIIGMPGDRIRYKNDQLWINEQEVVERFLEKSVYKVQESGMKFTDDFTLAQAIGVDAVPVGKYFVLGDNRPFATDSRAYGLIDENKIVGTVEMLLFPLHKLGQF